MSSSHRTLASRHSVDSCAIQLHSWRPFHPKPLDPDLPQVLPNSSSHVGGGGGGGGFHPKRPCLSDRVTSFSIDAALDMSALSLFDDDRSIADVGNSRRRESLQSIARKRRRRGSRSVSGRSSDRSGTRRCCSVGASAAASDFPMVVGTDSSGELFGNGDWASDVSEARINNGLRRDKDGGGGGSGERENLGSGFGQTGHFGDVVPGNESGYGSEPGYRGDAEFGYGDEVDEEEEDARALFWGHQFGGIKHLALI
ncbi:hypothetical protein BT93_L3710 [Corymbia citriodora subsp. variegata]|uniref:Uncharacterized protein n=1 Tax=Corymbia citriodora subsp. variegata TaxID=360336 RepID=A0A8T0CGQ5_CORYI|nr:hypothetical protein BT93_L3710 [Corymbia citriodora subsp. variegata]